MNRRTILVALATLMLANPARSQTPSAGKNAELVEVRKIWDAAAHNAFTDLLRHGDRWFCVFREGAGHVSPDGAIRVLTSTDGREWSSAARLAVPGADLRDPKLSATPDGRLMIVAAAARDRKPDGRAKHQSMVFFSRDGREWDEGRDVADPDFWLWRVTWHDRQAYGVAYGTDRSSPVVRLYRSRDGLHFETLVGRLDVPDFPNESSLVFLDDGAGLCLLRRDAGTRTGMLGTSRPPYTDWKWRDLGVPIGGPRMIRLPDGRLVVGGRLYDGKVRTSLGGIDPEAGTFRELLALPSGGDTSYPGLVWHDGLLWVSYYSSHEGKARIYLAKVRLPER
jgi:hypothetical protein